MTYRQIWRKGTQLRFPSGKPRFWKNPERLTAALVERGSVSIFGWVEPYIHLFMTFLFLDLGEAILDHFSPVKVGDPQRKVLCSD